LEDADAKKLKTKNARIKREKRRLAGLFEKLPEDTQKSAEKLIERAAFMLISLEDMEETLKADGNVQKMPQGNYAIDRAHPLLSPYTAMAKNYAAICKQLAELLPERAKSEEGEEIARLIGEKKALL
jgi:hypothetical protein